jgi:hypothetical protein
MRQGVCLIVRGVVYDVARLVLKDDALAKLALHRQEQSIAPGGNGMSGATVKDFGEADLAALEALREAATQGEWRRHSDYVSALHKTLPRLAAALREAWRLAGVLRRLAGEPCWYDRPEIATVLRCPQLARGEPFCPACQARLALEHSEHSRQGGAAPAAGGNP